MTTVPDPGHGYVDDLATQLVERHPDLLATAENDLALLRGQLALTTQPKQQPSEQPEPAQEQT